MFIKILFGALLFVYVSSSSSSKPKLTLDEFIDYTDFTSFTLAPDDKQWILIQTKHRIWNQSVTEYHLYLQALNGKERKIITTYASSSFTPLWQGEWIAFMYQNNYMTYASDSSIAEYQYYIHFYSTQTEDIIPIPLGKEPLHALAWSHMTLYFATRTPWTREAENAYLNKWKHSIQYRDQERGDTIYRVNIEDMMTFEIETLTNISLRIGELTCSPDGKRLVFSTYSRSAEVEFMKDFEIYSFDLRNHSQSTPLRLTNNKALEKTLKWFNDDSIFFTVSGQGSIEGDYRESQGRLYSINVTNGRIERWADHFEGAITHFALLQNGRGGAVILGQLGTEIQVYTQQSPRDELIKRTGWNGSYEMIVTSSGSNSSKIAFIHSSFDAPQEVYSVNNIDYLSAARAVTSENRLFTQRNLPKGKSYQWVNKDDRTEIEGVLLYPPDKFEQKNLPLLVLIHGGPYEADLNHFRASWYNCAGMMATEDWLVLQPNYRGSSGYGDDFMNGVLYQMLSRPGKDILFGVDALIRDGIADPKRLTIGGYSYGGYLTNWLITQTTRFNAAISGAGAVENVADWGTNDMPITNAYFLGGFPWQMSNRYQQEAAIFQLNRVRTPTHIVAPANDIRVPVAQNYILERSLTVLRIPTKLIVFPNEGHFIGNNPWHEKIKLREELKWLHKYGNICVSNCIDSLSSSMNNEHMRVHTSIFVLCAFFIQSFVNVLSRKV